MDNLNYVSKKLVAEYREKENSDFKVIETAYIQGNDHFIIEYDGGKNSLYSVAKTFFECEARKGSYKLNKCEYELWKRIRKECDKNNYGRFVEWDINNHEALELDLNDYINNSINAEHESIIKSLNDSDLPF